MEVKFLKDFRGKETREVFYPAGSVAGVKDHYAARLIELGFAEPFEPLMPVTVEHEAEILPPEMGVTTEEAPQLEAESTAEPEVEEVEVKQFKPKAKPKVKK